MLTVLIVTVAFFPVYLFLRTPYRDLPLHTDTGYYVSNHTIATRRFRFSKGWNARYAGCSKVLPEFFYSWVYLRGCRTEPYKRQSRVYASLFNYATAMAVGAVASCLTDWNTSYYVAGLVVFALLSSEPQWGVYYECGEFFELLPQVLAAAFLAVGLTTESPAWILLGAFTWTAEACFVKLSSMIGAGVLLGVLVTHASWVAVPYIIGTALATLAYAAWVYCNGQSPLCLVRRLVGHEASFGQRTDGRLIAHRLREKAVLLARTVISQPIIPILACLGAATGGDLNDGVAWLMGGYLVSVLVTYVAQATDCWYYQIPLLVPVSLYATQGVVVLGEMGNLVVALVFAAVLWLGHNTLRAYRLERRKLVQWCWNGNEPERSFKRDCALEGFCRRIKSAVEKRSLLVYGDMNQAYVLTGSCYEVALVAPEHCLDDVCPKWQVELNGRLVDSPPQFVLDTSNCFDAAVAREALGLDYELSDAFDPDFRLFALRSQGAHAGDFGTAQTFRPQSAEQLRAEAGATVDHTDTLGQSDRCVLTEMLAELARQGRRRIGIYGAGRYTVRQAEVYRASSVTVVVVFDDRPERHGAEFLGWRLCRLEDAHKYEIDAVVVSTDRFVGPMVARARKFLKGDVLVVRAEAGVTCETIAERDVAVGTVTRSLS